MSRERFVIDLGSNGTWERKSGDDHAQVTDRLKDMFKDRALDVRKNNGIETEICVVDLHNTKEKQYWTPFAILRNYLVACHMKSS